MSIAGQHETAFMKPTKTVPSRRSMRGFSMMEAVITVAIIMILAAAVIPMVQVTFRIFQLRSAVASVRGVIQSTRYRAISDGYPYQITFDSTNGTYQLASNPGFQTVPTPAYTNIGGVQAISGSSVVVKMSADQTMQFSPSGRVTFVTGTGSFTLTLLGNVKTFTVSQYGNVNVI